MQHRQNPDVLALRINKVHDPIAAVNQLPDRSVSYLRHDSAQAREALQLMRFFQNSFHEKGGVVGGDLLKIRLDGFEVFSCLGPPFQTSHNVLPLSLITRLFELLDDLGMRDALPFLCQSSTHFMDHDQMFDEVFERDVFVRQFFDGLYDIGF